MYSVRSKVLLSNARVKTHQVDQSLTEVWYSRLWPPKDPWMCNLYDMYKVWYTGEKSLAKTCMICMYVYRESFIEPILFKVWINWFADGISHFKNSVPDSPLLYVSYTYVQYIYVHIFYSRPINLICGFFISFMMSLPPFILLDVGLFHPPDETDMRAWSRGPEDQIIS